MHDEHRNRAQFLPLVSVINYVRRIIDAALAAGWRPEEPGRPTFVIDGYPFLDSIPEG
jgi:hypothetical protein